VPRVAWHLAGLCGLVSAAWGPFRVGYLASGASGTSGGLATSKQPCLSPEGEVPQLPEPRALPASSDY